MSKQSQAKQDQHYRMKADACLNCAHFCSDQIEKTYDAWNGKRAWIVEKNLRCGIGGFAVKKSATCDRHALKKGDAA